MQPLPPPTKMKKRKEKSYTMQTQINLVVVGQSQQYHAMLKAGVVYRKIASGQNPLSSRISQCP